MNVLFSLVDNKIVWPMARQNKGRQYYQTKDGDEEVWSQEDASQTMKPDM